MRIIKNPNPVEEIVKTCPECECEFAYTEGDVKTYAYSNEIIGPGYYGYRKKYILCPNCGKEIVLEEKSTSGRDSMIDPSMITIDIQKLIDESEIEPTKDEVIEGFENLGPDIEEITMFPHLTNPDEEDGE